MHVNKGLPKLVVRAQPSHFPLHLARYFSAPKKSNASAAEASLLSANYPMPVYGWRCSFLITPHHLLTMKPPSRIAASKSSGSDPAILESRCNGRKTYGHHLGYNETLQGMASSTTNRNQRYGTPRQVMSKFISTTWTTTTFTSAFNIRPDLLIDENLVLQENSDEEGEGELPPQAPTPPPGRQGLAQPPPPQRLADWQNDLPDPGPANANANPDRPNPTAANRTTERGERERKKEEERLRRERVVQRVRQNLQRCGACDLTAAAWEECKDRLRVERLVRASGIFERGSKTAKDEEKVYTIITGEGWVVRVDAELVRNAYADAGFLRRLKPRESRLCRTGHSPGESGQGEGGGFMIPRYVLGNLCMRCFDT
ncbi:hypothetical protein K505DRAFT_421220 [Melanomma pulvis-pyrius CBS 109.77]|uniref:Uncharacterized protein n=1 Tax=Melanomma pulvis-pyrius CBS 109.77 TaxID=1314802 RepID=A0A6A6WVN5_9PLEO|nr:hypothetical protein K505DRAFT_421220 [Melanomma pulvis-pyrius CBS 109.77]